MIDAMNTVFGSGKQKSAALKKYSRVNGHKLNVSTKALRNALETR